MPNKKIQTDAKDERADLDVIPKKEAFMLNLPPILVTPAAWKGAEIRSKPELWIWELESDDVNELTTATQQFFQSGEPLENISKSNFHLPGLEKKLAKIKMI